MVISNLLCFVASAKNDFSRETLMEVAESLYSHDRIKAAKTALLDLLRKDLPVRRDPEKKRKDLKDVMDLYEEASAANKRMKFVADSYKAMPPVGMEFLAPLLLKLTVDVSRINEVLPKMVDIRTEVTNTADAVKQVRSDVIDLKKNFNSAIKGISDATIDVSDELELLQDVRAFRMSISGEGSPMKIPPNIDEETATSLTYSQAVSTTINEVNAHSVDGLAPKDNRVTESFGFPSGEQVGACGSSSRANGSHYGEFRQRLSSAGDGNGTGAGTRKSGWVTVQKGKAQQGKNPTRSSNHNNPVGNRKRNNYRVTGVKRMDDHAFIGVKKTIDVFLGRVTGSVECQDIKTYIKDVFNIDVINIEELEILSVNTKAFKITVYLDERECLFDSELWPEGVVVDKFYKKRN